MRLEAFVSFAPDIAFLDASDLPLLLEKAGRPLTDFPQTMHYLTKLESRKTVSFMSNSKRKRAADSRMR